MALSVQKVTDMNLKFLIFLTSYVLNVLPDYLSPLIST